MIATRRVASMQLLGSLATVGLPVLVALLVWKASADRLTTATALLVAIGVLAIVASRPGTALVALVGFLPFQQLTLALLYRFGVPAPVVRALGGTKEVVVAGAVVAAFAWIGRSRTSFGRLERILACYLGAVVAYFVLPGLLAPSGPRDLAPRLLALRSLGLFVLAYFAARYAPLGEDTRRRFDRTIFTVGVVVSTIALYEFLFSSSWNSFVVEFARVPTFKSEVLGVASTNASDVRIYGSIGSRTFVRAGSVFFGSGGLAFYLLLPLARALQRIAAGRATAFEHIAAAMMAVTILLTVTRSGVLSAIVVALCVLARRPGGTARNRRAQLALLLCAGAVLALPIAGQSALGARTAGVVNGADPSAPDHLSGLSEGLGTLRDHPLGAGLGTGPGEQGRFGVEGSTSENAYIEIGNQLGIPVMLLYIVLLVTGLRQLARRASTDDGQSRDLAAWLFAGGVGIGVGGLFLHVWNFELALTFWTGVGLALRPSAAGGQSDAVDLDVASRSS